MASTITWFVRHQDERSRCYYIPPSSRPMDAPFQCVCPPSKKMENSNMESSKEIMVWNFLCGTGMKGVRAVVGEGGPVALQGLHCHWWDLPPEHLVLQRNAALDDVWIDYLLTEGGLGTEQSILAAGLGALAPPAAKLFLCPWDTGRHCAF